MESGVGNLSPPLLFFGGRYANSSFKYLDFAGPTAKSVFEMHGARVTDDMNLADAVVLLDMDNSTIEQIIEFNVEREKCILIRSEPLCVLPENYDPTLLGRIGLIIESGASPINNGIVVKRGQFWPESDPNALQVKKIERFVVVNSNQLSLVKGELYSLRRECIQKIEQVDLFGNGWDVGNFHKLKVNLFHLWRCVCLRIRPHFRSLKFFFSRPKHYGGALNDKLGEMAKYKFALVIENSLDHLTEKLFDAFFAKCIPIYVGPSVADYGIPSDLVIQAEPTLEGVLNAMKLASKTDPVLWSTSVDRWLNQSNVRTEWEAHSIVDTTISKIHGYLRF
jgi:hypothetical protein